MLYNKKRIISSALSILMLSATCFTACKKEEMPKAVTLYKEGASYTETVKGTPEQVNAIYYAFLAEEGGLADGSDVMPIGGFYAPYASGGSVNGNEAADFLTDEIFSALADCGINAMFYSVDRWVTDGTNTALKKAIDLCEEHKIGYYVDMYYVNGQLGSHTENYPLENMTLNKDSGKQKLQALIDDVTENGTKKSVLGIMGKDEPFTSELDNLGVLTDAFYGLNNTTGMDVYMNALGYWAGEDNLYGYSDPLQYDNYMQQYFEVAKPRMLSVTQYPYVSEKTPETTIAALLYDQLSVYKKYADAYNVPFWRMLQAGGQWNDAGNWVESKPAYPSEGELLYDVNLALAYGAKAIQYFPLIQPQHFAYGPEENTYDYENRNGLIGGDGNKTRWYYYAQRANAQVKAVDEYLMKSANVGVIVHGEQAKQAFIEGAAVEKEEILTAGSFRQLKQVSGGDCIVGCFDYMGGTALYVVNYNREAKADVTLTFDRNDYRYQVIQRAKSFDVIGGEMTLTLDTGEGALIVLA